MLVTTSVKPLVCRLATWKVQELAYHSCKLARRWAWLWELPLVLKLALELETLLCKSATTWVFQKVL